MRISNIIARVWFRHHGVRWSGSSPGVDGLHLPSLSRHKGSSIALGSRCNFGRNVSLCAWDGGRLTIGANALINHNSFIIATSAVSLGDNVLIATDCSIVDSNFHPVSPAKPRRVAPVVIGNNVWLGMRSVVLPGVTIGDNSIVSAGSVVTRSLPANCVAMGNPAQVVSTFDCHAGWVRSEEIPA